MTAPATDPRLLAIGKLVRGIALVILLLNLFFSLFGFSAFSDSPPSSGPLLQRLDSDLLVISLAALLTGQFLIYKAHHNRWPLHPFAAAVILLALIAVTLGPIKAFSYGLLMAALLYKIAAK